VIELTSLGGLAGLVSLTILALLTGLTYPAGLFSVAKLAGLFA
jgi:hypothetical protein